MGCGSSKVKVATETKEQLEIRLLANQGPDGLRDAYIELVKGGGDIRDHYSFRHMSSKDIDMISDLFAGYSTNQILNKQRWEREFNAKWDVFWKTGSGSKWLKGKSARDTKERFALLTEVHNVSLTDLKSSHFAQRSKSE